MAPRVNPVTTWCRMVGGCKVLDYIFNLYKDRDFPEFMGYDYMCGLALFAKVHRACHSLVTDVVASRE